MSDDELMDAWTEEGKVFEKSKARLKEFSAEHDKRLVKASVEQRLAGMTDTERSALTQLVQTEGIESQESVHNG